jgi:hypothetical protein
MMKSGQHKTNIVKSRKNMIKYKRYFMVILFSFIINASASTYYVSSDGKDGNSGTSPDSPWKNCPGMPGWSGSVRLIPGDKVYFNSADTWSVSSGDAVLMTTGGVMYDGQSWGTGKKAIFRATEELRRSVVSFLSDDPTYPTVVVGFELDANQTVTTGIGLNFPFWSNSMTGATKRIEDCIVHDIYSETNRGEYEYGIIISNWGGNKAIVENVEIINCIVYNVSRGGIIAYPGGDQAENKIGNILIRNCEVYNTGQDPGYDAGTGIGAKNRVYNTIIEYNYLHNTGGPGILISGTLNGFTGVENAIIRYNIFAKNNHDALHLREKGDKSLKIYGNIFLAGNASALKVDGSAQGGLDLKFYNNTVYETSILIQNSSSTITALEFINNIIYSPGQRTPLSDSGNNITLEKNNIYTDPSFQNISNLPTGFTGTYGVDMEPNANGLNITSKSPARDAGTSLEASYDMGINTVKRPNGSGWDIGAYELGDPSSLNLGPMQPDSYSLYQNEPNPFNPSTKIKFNLPSAENVTIEVINSLGQSIETLLDEYKPSGYHEVEFHGQNLASGIYFYRIDAGEFMDVKRMILLK